MWIAASCRNGGDGPPDQLAGEQGKPKGTGPQASGLTAGIPMAASLVTDPVTPACIGSAA
ncbi:hypothetical protein B0A89_06565 [Paracoccus contaminans]|uniref:Uncharacterized protein n=1 Tax=Paracoccus contaminans TaxID=1945662 RepID=A0A1W6CWV7_9RHOB|nr:hypothetical protein B0A89_06565 [Paracoccus contaminans]